MFPNGLDDAFNPEQTSCNYEFMRLWCMCALVVPLQFLVSFLNCVGSGGVEELCAHAHCN